MNATTDRPVPDGTDDRSQQRYLEPRAPEPGRAWSWSAGRRAEDADQGPTGEGFQTADDEDAAVYVISVAAELAELHPQTLRAYEREGLLTPARTEGGTRRYSRRDVERLRLIKTLTTDEGLNLAGVRVVLELGEKLEGARRRVGELEEMVRVLAERLDARPQSERFDVVKSPPRDVEVHQLRRRTGQRGPSRPNTRPSVQRATPIPPPERRAADA
ncbi:MAG: helix-turn-helix transcriptional regulator [Nitriliruptor sp.]